MSRGKYGSMVFEKLVDPGSRYRKLKELEEQATPNQTLIRLWNKKGKLKVKKSISMKWKTYHNPTSTYTILVSGIEEIVSVPKGGRWEIDVMRNEGDKRLMTRIMVDGRDVVFTEKTLWTSEELIALAGSGRLEMEYVDLPADEPVRQLASEQEVADASN